MLSRKTSQDLEEITLRATSIWKCISPNTVFATSPSMITLIPSTLLPLTLLRSEICLMICIRRTSPKRLSPHYIPVRVRASTSGIKLLTDISKIRRTKITLLLTKGVPPLFARFTSFTLTETAYTELPLPFVPRKSRSLPPLQLNISITPMLHISAPIWTYMTGVTELFPPFSPIQYMQDISEDSKDRKSQPRARKDTQGIQRLSLWRICTNLSLNPKSGSLFRLW